MLVVAGRARADTPCDQTLTEVNYEADTLAQDDPVAPWQVNEVGIVTQSVQNGVLVVDALSEGSIIVYNRPEADLANASAYSIEARMWYTNLLVPPTQSTGTLSVRDGEKQVSAASCMRATRPKLTNARTWRAAKTIALT